MRPFKQTETGMTRTAKVLDPEADQMYNAYIQQNEVRARLEAALIGLKQDGKGVM